MAMTAQVKDPIVEEWTTAGPIEGQNDGTVTDVNRLLSTLSVADIDDALVPFLAAAGAESALVAGIRWSFGADDPPVALLRLIAKAALRCPDASGPHTTRLLAALRSLAA